MPRNPAERLLVPVGRQLFVPGMGMAVVPMAMRKHVSGIARGDSEAREIGHFFGRTTKPDQPLMVVGPDERTPILIVGDGVTEAAEMEDLAQAAVAKQAETVKKTGSGYDFAEARERKGSVRREDFGRLASEAVLARIAKHKHNMRTDPPRKPQPAPGWEPTPTFYMGSTGGKS